MRPKKVIASLNTTAHGADRCSHNSIVADLFAFVRPQLSPELTSHIDDEYARAGVYDPKVLVTTSRDPSSRLQQFAKEMRLVFPNSQRINRGGHVMKEIVDACKANDVTDLIILHEHRGEPGNTLVAACIIGRPGRSLAWKAEKLTISLSFPCNS